MLLLLLSLLNRNIIRCRPPEAVELINVSVDSGRRDAFTDLHSLVEDAAADLNHLQVLLLLVPRTLDIRHPAPLVLLTGIDEIPDGPILVKYLWGHTSLCQFTFITTLNNRTTEQQNHRTTEPQNNRTRHLINSVLPTG